MGKSKIKSRNAKSSEMRWGSLVVSVSPFHLVGRGLAPRSRDTNDCHINCTNCLPAWHACVMVGVWQCNPNWVKVCGTVYGDMLYKDLLGSIARVGLRIPFPDFYLAICLHGLWCRKTLKWINQSINQNIETILDWSIKLLLDNGRVGLYARENARTSDIVKTWIYNPDSYLPGRKISFKCKVYLLHWNL